MTPQPITIHQFHHSVSPGDGVTNQMRFLRRVLSESGVQGTDFASLIPSDLPGFSKLDPMQLWNADLVLVHHSTGNPALKDILKVEVPKALIYHNVTPPVFLSHDPVLAELSDLGRSQLDLFRGQCVAVFGDSQYNLLELAERGMPNGRVLPLFDLAELKSEQIGPIQRKPGKGPRLLFVGRVTPNKNQLLLLKALYYLVHQLNVPAELRIVGRMHPIYGTYLRQMVESLGLSAQVEFSSHVSQTELAASYRTADLFVCVSQHEGFCIPLVEAMLAELPVLATPNTGISETLGNAGLQLLTLEASEIAEAIAAVWADAPFRHQILASQDARLQEIAQIENSTRARELCLDLVRKARNPPDLTPPSPQSEATN